MYSQPLTRPQPHTPYITTYNHARAPQLISQHDLESKPPSLHVEQLSLFVPNNCVLISMRPGIETHGKFGNSSDPDGCTRPATDALYTPTPTRSGGGAGDDAGDDAGGEGSAVLECVSEMMETTRHEPSHIYDASMLAVGVLEELAEKNFETRDVLVEWTKALNIAVSFRGETLREKR